MNVFNIVNEADQQFSAFFDNRRVTLRLRYNKVLDRWMFDLSIDDVPVLNGRRIVNDRDLLRGFGFGIGALVAFSPSNAEPTRNTLPGGKVKLYQLSPAEMAAAA
jgi:hypothetical protein